MGNTLSSKPAESSTTNLNLSARESNFNSFTLSNSDTAPSPLNQDNIQENISSAAPTLSTHSMSSSTNPSSTSPSSSLPSEESFKSPSTSTSAATKPPAAMSASAYFSPTNFPNMENIHAAAHEIFPTHFEGLKLAITQGLHQHFQLSHTFSLNNSESAGYRFGATYVGNHDPSSPASSGSNASSTSQDAQQQQPSELFPVMIAELRPNGDLQSQVVHQFGGSSPPSSSPSSSSSSSPSIGCAGPRLKYIAQIKSGVFATQQASVELRRERIQLGVSLMNPDLAAGGHGIALLDVMRRLRPGLSMGTFLVLQRSAQSAVGLDAMFSVGAHLHGNLPSPLSAPPQQQQQNSDATAADSAASNSASSSGNGGAILTNTQPRQWVCAASLKPLQLGANLSCWLRLYDQLRVGAHFETSLPRQESTASIGYQFELGRNISVKAQLDTEANLVASYERRFLQPVPFSVCVSVMGLLPKSKYSLGLGLSLFG